MKQTFQQLIFCCLLLTATMAAKAQFSGNGSGTSGDPYIITNYTHLNQVRNDLTAHYRLEADVNAGAAWVPIGDNTTSTVATQFTGTFDGNGHTVTITGIGTVPLGSGFCYVGLFGYLGSGATVQNLKIAGSLSFTTNNGGYVGGIAGRNTGGTIKNCVGAADITLSGSSNQFYAGGIAGANRSTIQNCYSTGDVSANSSYSTSSAFAGGIASSNAAGSLTNCYATGNIEASASTGAYSGGIAGSNEAALSNCVALNAGVSIGSATTQLIGRITGVINSTSIITNNRSIDIFNDDTAGALNNDKNGLLITQTEAETRATYETGAGWAFDGYSDAAPWVWSTSLLRPILYWEIKLQGAIAITGTPTYGETLTANTGGITSPAPLGALSYQWKRNSADISGATGNTYALTSADIGSTITVEVRASNYFSSLTSAPTATITAKAVTITGITATKVYDSTTGFTNAQINITGATITGIVGTDVVTVNKTGVTGTYGPNVGTGTLSLSGSFTLSGAYAGNYSLSSQPTVAADITPANAAVQWGNTTFTYTGSPQAPTATITGVGTDGTINLSVSSAQTVAGTGYAATATFAPTNTNYTLSNTTTTFDINAANTATTLTAVPNPSNMGQTVTFTATVAAVSPGGGTPAGTVEFREGGVSGVLLGTATLDASGVATFNTSSLSAGSHPVTAFYTGNNNYNPSNSTVTNLTVYAPMQVTVTSAGTGASGSGYYLPGATVSIDAGTPPPGTRFAGWTSVPAITFADALSPATTFTMPASAVTVTAAFESIYNVTISAVSNGQVSADRMSAYPGETVTLTLIPNAYYRLSSIHVYETSSPATTIPVSGTGDGYRTDGSIGFATRTFTMPDANVTVTAYFENPTYLAAWEAAKSIIEAADFSVLQKEANTLTELRYRLAEIINELLCDVIPAQAGISFTISPYDIVIFDYNFLPAQEGTPENRSGTNGYFAFRVTPPETRSSAYNDGVITATLYEPTTSNEEWRMQNAELKAWMQNGVLCVSGLTAGKPWYVYNLYGQLIYTGIADGEKAEIPLSGKGIYIITNDNKKVKISH